MSVRNFDTDLLKKYKIGSKFGRELKVFFNFNSSEELYHHIVQLQRESEDNEDSESFSISNLKSNLKSYLKQTNFINEYLNACQTSWINKDAFEEDFKVNYLRYDTPFTIEKFVEQFRKFIDYLKYDLHDIDMNLRPYATLSKRMKLKE